jgi:Predicted P-loop-containing kinase
MRFVIVTGMSGAGKRTAMKILEDADFFCVDNLPIPLMDKFTDLVKENTSERFQKIALGMDVRIGEETNELKGILEHLKAAGIPYEILFLEAEDEVIVKRYKETRRNHPLSHDVGRVGEAITRERETLQFLKDNANYIIDTSRLLTRELKVEIDKIFVDNQNFNNLIVSIVTFGFKHGIPKDSDLVFDVRFLPNPYYMEELRLLTGHDIEVQEYVMQHEAAQEFLEKLEAMMKFLIPNYVLEGKNHLIVSIGCTGGKHRSVTLAKALYDKLNQINNLGVRIEHRDIHKDSIIKKV